MECITYKEYLEWLLENSTEKSEQERLKNLINDIESKKTN